MKRRFFFAILVLILASCQVIRPPAAPTTKSEAKASPQPSSTPRSEEPALQPLDPSPADQPVNTTSSELVWDTGKLFAGGTLTRWQPQPYTETVDALPLDLTTLANPGVISNLTESQRAMLTSSGFTVLPAEEKQFGDIRDQVSKLYGQPYYLTTDAAYHALYLTFDEVLKILERDHLRPQAVQMLQGMLAQVQAFPDQGTPLVEDTRLAAAYLAVALRLFDPSAVLPAGLAEQAGPQIEQILAGGGRAKSVLVPNFEDDYGAYKPVGHYAGDEQLEAYFRGMTWLGRVAFLLKDSENPQYQPTRVPLLLTLALRQNADATQAWKSLNEMLNFLIGPCDDPGPAELLALMNATYGINATFEDLGDPDRWQQFLAQVDQLPAPQINSTFVESTAALQASRDWRLLGQRFTFDAAIFQNLIYDRVGTPDQQRKVPSGLDVMAVFGSPAAMQASRDAGSYGYANYEEQLLILQTAADQQPQEQWLNRFYSGWLYAFFPQVAPKDSSYPPYMRTPAWQYKELNSALGSWTELKHAAALYAKMPEFMGGGGPPGSGPAPAYVEPNPDVFYRLAFISSELSTGLMFRVPVELQADGVNYSYWLQTLAERYQQFGDIAARELRGDALTTDDYTLLQECLGPVECVPDAFSEVPPVPLVAAVSGADADILQAATGYLDRIYVAVPINGQLQIAQGGIFAYYEFLQPRSDRLTDAQWRQILDDDAPDRPTWVSNFLLPGGSPSNILAFRAGDWYIITAEGGSPPLNVRAQPLKSAAILTKLEEGAYIELVDGPEVVDGDNWWKIRLNFGEIEGWVMENPAWFERAYGQ